MDKPNLQLQMHQMNLMLQQQRRLAAAQASAQSSDVYPAPGSYSGSRRLRLRPEDMQATQIVSHSSDEEGEEAKSDDNETSNSDSSSDSDTKKSKSKRAKMVKGKKKDVKNSTTDGTADWSKLVTLLATMSKPGPTPTLTTSTFADPLSSDPLAPLPMPASASGSSASATEIAQQVVQLLRQEEQTSQSKKAPGKVGSKVAFKRVDQVYDRKIHNFKLKETVQGDTQHDKWDQYVFNVRRSFDPSSRYISTSVDIKSKHLRDCLKDVMGEIKGINLVTEKPAVDPNMLFLHLEELRSLQDDLTAKFMYLQDRKDKKERKALKLKSQHLKVLVEYLDEDFADTKKALYPMLDAGIITFEYLWALFKPNTILYSSTYDDEDEPRACKTVYSKETRSFMKGTTYDVEARYLEYDGKAFGLATVHMEIASFAGARKIASLPCYPLRYHKTPELARARLIERGKKFVSLQGMNYRTYKGMTYMKKEEKLLKVDVSGRVMIDPAIFRRVNPNYPLNFIRAAEGDIEDFVMYGGLAPPGTDPGSNTTTTQSLGQPTPASDDFDEQKHFKVIKDDAGQHVVVEIGPDEAAQAAVEDRSDEVFDEEQLLIASPVVIGFSFSEKLWLEFAVSKIGDIKWNTDAFDSLILPDNQKSIVKALVSSHAFHAARSIDDIIAGKGKGLVAVLHGGPGLGKTLTVESIADLLKRPLYMVSAGDLGTNPQTLERELQSILDIAHAWGAVLLLDEADVFLEKRSTHDIHRNALVSIFLRLLEYFQGILFLTTNRVEVFDEAFISRIHLSLRYGDLSTKAKKAVWKTFIDKVREVEGMQIEEISDKDLDELSRRALNGRQIKNIVRAAQSLAIYGDVALGLHHIREVLAVAQTFERDLKGGTGYEDAMRGYT